MGKPLVSVIMGIYNCENTLREAILSIQKQTYQNWELIMCDDGSTDRTYSIAAEYTNNNSHQIILIKNNCNLGLNRTLNRCLELSKGKYIARMDGDDISLPTRFEKEVAFLEKYEDFAIVGCPMVLFDEKGDYDINHVISNPDKKSIICGNPISHATVLMRKDAIMSVGGYSEDKRTIRVEDVDLWIRFYAKGYRAHNLKEPLYKMRNDRNAYARRKYRYRVNSVLVRYTGCRVFHLPVKYYLKASRPMLIGLIPNSIRRIIKQRNRKSVCISQLK